MSSFADTPPTVEKLSSGRVVSYALGDVANNLSFMMTSLFLMAYMTDIAGVSAAAAGTIYGVTKIWAGVADLIAGNTVDKANTRWGRLRPWILFGSLPLAATLVLLFSVPAGITGTAAVVWILLFDAAFQICYSFVNIPYGSLSAAMTQDPVDRSRLAGARSIASAVTGVLLAIVLAPQFQDTQADNIRLKFTITTLVLAAIAVVLYLICFRNTREVVPRTPGRMKLATTLKMVVQNRPLLVLCLGALFLLGAMFTMSAVMMFYAMYVLGSASTFIWLQIAQTVGTVLVASFVPLITVKLGKRIGYVALALVAVVAYVLIATVPGGQGTAALVMAVVAWLVYGLGVGGTNALMFSMQADTVDYGEWRTGVRAEGGSYSVLSFVRKTGQGIGGWAGGLVLGLYGYSKGAVDAADPATMAHIEQGIRIAAGWVPAVLGLAAAAVILFYPLTADKHRSLVSELSRRRAARVAETVGIGTAGSAVGIASDGALTAERPVITFNEQYGAGAAYVAERVAERLGVPYLASKFSSEDIETIDRAPESEPGPNRFLWDLAHASYGAGADADAATAGDAESRTEIVRQNFGEILGAVKVAGGTVVGRDATVVLADMHGAYHVRLEAPVQQRIERAAEAAGISLGQAATRQAREDQLRTEMSWRLMQWTPSKHEHYDLVIDTGSTSLDDAVDQVVEGYRQAFPDLG